jgi:site-specific DNA-methyltransferase (adenine-specific)
MRHTSKPVQHAKHRGKDNPMKAPKHTLYQGDAFAFMSSIKDKGIDLICTDLPYGITQNKWDSILPLDKMWAEFNRVITDRGAIVLTASQPFAAKLICSNESNFRYDLIWEKTIASGQLNVNRMPLRVHESILVFYKKTPVYNEQKTVGTPYKISRKITSNANYGLQKANSKENDGYRHARSVIKISNPRIKGGHPTQKPLELMELLIKMYSKPGDTVLDCCMGSGTTGVAAQRLNRVFYGSELDKRYFATAEKRIREEKIQ